MICSVVIKLCRVCYILLYDLEFATWNLLESLLRKHPILTIITNFMQFVKS